MRERDNPEIIRAVEDNLGLERSSPPTWGYDLGQANFPEEAPTREQRKFAGWFLRNLSFFISGYEVAIQRAQAPPLTPAHIQAFYYQEREGMRYRWGDDFADFNLTHVLGSAKRQIAWLEELKAFEETTCYDGMLQRLRRTRALLDQTVNPNSPSDQSPDRVL